MNSYVDVLKNYVGFGGRARRKEYWMFVLFNVAIVVVLAVVGLVIKTNIPVIIYWLAVLLPALAVVFRRLHDTGRSAWWILISIVPLVGPITLLVFLALEGQPGDNKYGPNPKQVQAPAYA